MAARQRDGDYGFSSLEPFIAAMNRHQTLPIWDLCHYGYPDDADPFAPDFVDEAEQETLEDTFCAWDVIAGNCHPELGGAPEILDIVGVNCYSFGQMEFREQGPHAALSPDDSRIKPLGGC